jgi:hypothetical protein
MSIMQHINKRQLWFLIIVSGLFIGGRYLQQPASEKSAASKSVDELDAALLADLQTRQFQIEEQAACVMECNGIAASQLTALMQPKTSTTASAILATATTPATVLPASWIMVFQFASSSKPAMAGTSSVPLK